MNTRSSLLTAGLGLATGQPRAMSHEPRAMSQAHLINNFAPFLRQAATANTVAAVAAAAVNCHR